MTFSNNPCFIQCSSIIQTFISVLSFTGQPVSICSPFGFIPRLSYKPLSLVHPSPTPLFPSPAVLYSFNPHLSYRRLSLGLYFPYSVSSYNLYSFQAYSLNPSFSPCHFCSLVYHVSSLAIISVCQFLNLPASLHPPCLPPFPCAAPPVRGTKHAASQWYATKMLPQ